MNRPLLITDCDEVLLHMVVPFAEWLDETRNIHFDLAINGFAEALRHKATGDLVEREDIWPLLDEFFATEMHRQQAISGAVEAIGRIARVADIVVLTNIGSDACGRRAAQLNAIGIDAPVIGNRGGKGVPISQIVADHQPSVTVFVDDLDVHHQSAATHAPQVWRLHMVGEPVVSGRIAPAAQAHARIDDWVTATRWILDRFAEGPPGLDRATPAVLNPAA